MKKIILLVGLVLFIAQPAPGCTIPVFRYALEKWDLTTYDIIVYHRGPLPADLQKTLEAWNAAPNKANVEITILDLDSKAASNGNNNHVNRFQVEGKNAKTPWMQVRYHAPRERAITTWTGPCNRANLANVLDSPMRQAILAQLTRGASGVFVLLTSGDEKKDRAAYDLAFHKLQKLEKEIKLPEQSKDGPQMRLPIALKVSLPLLVLDRTKPEEAALVKRLLLTEKDLDQVKGPILFSVFGKGRALPPLYGEELNEFYLFKVTEYLCGKCSCDIKNLNPGDDLLMVANWDAVFNRLFEAKEGVAMPAGSFTLAPHPQTEPVKPEPQAVPKTEAPTAARVAGPVWTVAPETETPATYCPLCDNWLWIATALAGVLVIGTGGWAAWSMLRK